ncbi:tetratricopeptide repeat protein [Acetivibrio cellulolyticus]|uniref:tetratricopeptide repeat protein n=1 Tax=Acetivibrio cellulolyticus TaxID=35830 RepID=UPI0001E2F650|nr:tetratricopeptide repeat protein [Acetivibrio cellulolyticus]
MKNTRLILLIILLGLVLQGCMIPNITKKYDSKKQTDQINELIKKEKYDDAFEKITVLVNKGKYDVEAMNNIAYDLIDKNKEEEGLYILQDVVRINPKYDTALNNLCWGYHRIGKYKISKYFGDKALQLLPNADYEYINVGDALRGLKKYDEAITCYDKALEKNVSSENAYWAYYGKAYAFYDKKEYTKAIENFKKYAELKPDGEESIRYYIIDAYKKLKQYDTAIQENKKYYSLDASDTQPLYSIADILIESKKDYDGALKYYEKIIQIDAKDALAYLEKAKCLAAQNKQDTAMENIKKAIELDPECLYELEYYEEFNKLMERNDFKLLYK